MRARTKSTGSYSTDNCAGRWLFFSLVPLVCPPPPPPQKGDNALGLGAIEIFQACSAGLAKVRQQLRFQSVSALQSYHEELEKLTKEVSHAKKIMASSTRDAFHKFFDLTIIDTGIPAQELLNPSKIWMAKLMAENARLARKDLSKLLDIWPSTFQSKQCSCEDVPDV